MSYYIPPEQSPSSYEERVRTLRWLAAKQRDEERMRSAYYRQIALAKAIKAADEAARNDKSAQEQAPLEEKADHETCQNNLVRAFGRKNTRVEEGPEKPVESTCAQVPEGKALVAAVTNDDGAMRTCALAPNLKTGGKSSESLSAGRVGDRRRRCAINYPTGRGSNGRDFAGLPGWPEPLRTCEGLRSRRRDRLKASELRICTRAYERS